MMGGKAAAQTVLDMRRTGDFSKRSCKQYERRVYKLFTHDFYLSQKMAEVRDSLFWVCCFSSCARHGTYCRCPAVRQECEGAWCSRYCTLVLAQRSQNLRSWKRL